MVLPWILRLMSSFKGYNGQITTKTKCNNCKEQTLFNKALDWRVNELNAESECTASHSSPFLTYPETSRILRTASWFLCARIIRSVASEAKIRVCMMGVLPLRPGGGIRTVGAVAVSGGGPVTLGQCALTPLSVTSSLTVYYFQLPTLNPAGVQSEVTGSHLHQCSIGNATAKNWTYDTLL